MTSAQTLNDYTVIIVDDDRDVIDAVSGVLTPRGYCTQRYSSLKSFFDALPTHITTHPKICLLLDLTLSQQSQEPIRNPLESGNVLIPVILMSGYIDINTVVKALKNGATHFLRNKPLEPTELLETLTDTIEKHQHQLAQQKEVASVKARFATLSEREKTLLQFIQQGYISRDMASELAISIKTVEYHRNNIRRKLKVKSLVELITLCHVYQHSTNAILASTTARPLPVSA